MENKDASMKVCGNRVKEIEVSDFMELVREAMDLAMSCGENLCGERDIFDDYFKRAKLKKIEIEKRLRSILEVKLP